MCRPWDRIPEFEPYDATDDHPARDKSKNPRIDLTSAL